MEKTEHEKKIICHVGHLLEVLSQFAEKVQTKILNEVQSSQNLSSEFHLDLISESFVEQLEYFALIDLDLLL